MPKYSVLADRFGGLNTALSPWKLPPGVASDLSDVDLSGGVIRPRWSDYQIDTIAAMSIYDWNGGYQVDSNVRYHYAEWGGRLFRSHYCPDSYKNVPQWTTSSTWNALGIKAPAAACTAGVGAAGTPNGTYTYYVTFYNVEGDESAPSAGASVTLASQRASLSAIPIGYGSGTTTNGSTSVTGVANPSYFRVGMRITAPAGIPAGTYVTAISGTTLTLSAAATATGARELQDAQVTGRKIYRSGGTVASTLLVTTIADVTTTTYTDNAADTALGAALTTSGCDVLPACGGFDVSPAGVLAAIAGDGIIGQTTGNVLWFSEVGKPWLSKPTNYIELPAQTARAKWGLERFCLFATNGVYGLLGTDATNYELVAADGRLPSDFHWPVAMGTEIWYFGTTGVCAYDGSSIRTISAEFLSSDFALNFAALTVGAARKGERCFFFTGTQALEYDPRLHGSPWVLHSTPASATETTQCVGISAAEILVGTTAGYYFFASDYWADRHTSYSYTTGYMSPGEHAGLKTFRATLVAGVGPWTSTPQVASSSSVAETGTQDVYTGPSPVSLYERRRKDQASGYKGRGIKMTVSGENLNQTKAANLYIDEIGVWVGEKRAVFP